MCILFSAPSLYVHFALSSVTVCACAHPLLSMIGIKSWARAQVLFLSASLPPCTPFQHASSVPVCIGFNWCACPCLKLCRKWRRWSRGLKVRAHRSLQLKSKQKQW